jgi:uncharacterized protein (DUF2267 family)
MTMDRDEVARVPRPVEEPTEKLFHDLEESGVLPEGISASEATSAVLCNLLMRVSGGEARDFVTAAPTTLRTLLGACMRHRDERPEMFVDRAEFLRRVADQRGIGTDVASRLSRAVFAAARTLLSSCEATHIENQLPRDLLELWRG